VVDHQRVGEARLLVELQLELVERAGVDDGRPGPLQRRAQGGARRGLVVEQREQPAVEPRGVGGRRGGRAARRAWCWRCGRTPAGASRV